LLAHRQESEKKKQDQRKNRGIKTVEKRNEEEPERKN
jgi:hypothetical protein